MEAVRPPENDGPALRPEYLDDGNDPTETWVVFLVDEQTYALRMEEVERIVRAVEIRPLPQSPPHVRGIINVQGRILPVVDLRLRFGQPSRDIRVEDHFIIANTPTVSAVLPVDAALGSIEVKSSRAPQGEETRGHYVSRIIPTGSEVVYGLDLDHVLSGEDAAGARDLATMLTELQPA